MIQKLRDLNYCGVPLSIILLCKTFCNGDCYTMSMNLSRAMDHFTLVHGDVNFLPLNDEYPNHSWIEKNGFVYDTSDGFRWDKDVYYLLFKPNVREVYNEESVNDYKDYQKILEQANEVQDIITLRLITQYIELLEKENPYINHKLLEQEINIWRQKNGIIELFPDKVIKQYQKTINNDFNNI